VHHSIISQLAETLPPSFLRTKVPELTGGISGAAGSLANEDSRDAKAGRPNPRGLFYVRGKAAYQRDPFLLWLAEQLSDKPSRGQGGGAA
jgi:hypothetical protein